MTTPPARAQVVSSFTVVKGAMINETYGVFKSWDFALSKRENLERLRAENTIGASSLTWLRDVAKVLNRRFKPDAQDRPLVVLAQAGCPLDEWKPLLLWHMTRDEFLVRDFLRNWLYPALESKVARIRVDDVVSYLAGVGERGGVTEHAWSETTTKRVAAGLVKMAADFGLLRRGVVRAFTTYHLPEHSFLYLLHALRDDASNPGKILSSPDWRLFLMSPADVETELLRLHQYRRLGYQVAGSLVELSLPCADAASYAKMMVS